MGNQTLYYYFQNIDQAIDLDEFTKVRILRIFKAVQDVSHETKPGMLMDKLTSGR